MLSASSPFSLVLFGASGHLAQLKLYPALFFLWQKKRLPEQCAIIGFARSQMDDEQFRKLVEQSIRTHVIEPNEQVLKSFLQHFYYQQGRYDTEADFTALNGRLGKLERGWKDAVRLAYYSVPPEVFATISENLCKGGVHHHSIPFRCIVEKPVGHNLKGFEEIKKMLLRCFSEEEIYLLDHYLGKEAVRNVYYLRFANPILERLFENSLISHVEITAMEDVGIQGRAGYFEQTGMFRDMFQSHLLMVMSLLTMRLQQNGSIREGRLHALSQIYLPHAADLNDIVLQGQYAPGNVRGEEVRGYTEEEGIDAASRTNTFAALHLMSRSARWEGVPFYLRSGKRLDKKETRISIQFQTPHPVGKDSAPNRLHIILQGEAGMRFELQTKLGGTEPAFRPLVLSDPLVCVGDCLPEHGLLILEAIHGVRQWFPSFEEVHTAWRLIDPIQSHLAKADTPLYPYAAGSRGPEEMDEWIARDSLPWLHL
ncbi:MAG: glucose-6-phosphate dehydrogenase [Candidatus Peribacteraceae bacterium]|nr:glucose-6-phosphate dehydrogenase [Candidatus Peribacteraceae bacterium]